MKPLWHVGRVHCFLSLPYDVAPFIVELRDDDDTLLSRTEFAEHRAACAYAVEALGDACRTSRTSSIEPPT